jgi:hypothetical protein
MGVVPNVLAALDAEALKRLLEQTNIEIARIKGQLEIARAQQKATGQYADPLWYAKASGALRFKQRDSQAIQSRLGELKEERRRRASREEAKFIEIARRRLDPALFEEIKREAEEHNG